MRLLPIHSEFSLGKTMTAGVVAITDSRPRTWHQANPIAPSDIISRIDVNLIAMPSSIPPLRFSAADRLHRSAEFVRLQRTGVRIQCPHFVLYGGPLPHDAERSRL